MNNAIDYFMNASLGELIVGIIIVAILYRIVREIVTKD